MNVYSPSGWGICGRKNVFYTKQSAKNKAIRISKKIKRKIYFYECPVCGWYHLSKVDHMIKTRDIKSEGVAFRR